MKQPPISDDDGLPITSYLVLKIRLKLSQFIHSLSCDGALIAHVPTTEYVTIDNECFLECALCKKKYHLTYVSEGIDPYDDGGPEASAE